MRVAYYAATLLEVGGGLEKYFIETAHDLSELAGVQVDICTMDDEFNLRYGRLHNLYFGKKFDPKLLYRESLASIQAKLGKARYFKHRTFKDLVRRFEDYDVVYSRNDITEPFFKYRMGYHNVPPIIFGCHIPHVYPIAEKLHAKLHNFLFTSFIYNWMANGITGFHVINNYTLGVMTKQFPRRRVAKVYYPFDFNAFAANADKYSFPGRLSNGSGKFQICWAGRLVEQKGVADLVRLIDQVNATQAKQVAWHLCGDGELKPLVVACCERWPNVKWWGHVSNLNMADGYRQANLFITTSKWEGYPYNVLEAQALGLPVVSFDIAGCNDMIDDGINGFVVQNLEEFVQKVRYFIDGNVLPPESKDHLRQKIDRRKIYADLLALFEACAKERSPRLKALPSPGRA